MIFERTIQFEPVSLKRHRHRLKGGTYDPSKKDKDEFVKVIGELPTDKMTKPLKCKLHFYCKRPKSHYKSGKKSNELKDSAPKYNTNNKDLDNMVKFVLDALNDKLYTDDCLIVEINCIKSYSHADGYIYVKFEEIDNNLETIIIN
jgi:Holliday junction resolvase RusA-like endonuclease